MTYTRYIHDRLTGVAADDGSAADVVFAGATDFDDGADKDVEYTYDTDGRLVSDANRGITSISYNALGLPAEVTFSDGSGITNRYGADGTLLQRVSREPLRMAVPVTLAAVTRPTVETVHNHIGAMTYRKGALWRIDTPSGYITADGQAHFYIRDHQGNVRQVTDSDGNVEQDSHYYPYGMLMGESGDILATARNGRNPLKPSDANPYLYGGKEYLTTGGANLLDFTARTYDPSTLLFHTPDPLRDKYLHVNSYLYCLGNPTNFIDPTGMKVAYGGKTDIDKENISKATKGETRDPNFKKLLETLDNDEDLFIIEFHDIDKPKNNGDGSYNGKFFVDENGIKRIYIDPKTTEYGNFGTVLAEEVYHGYQTIVFESGVNIEYEAHTFAFLHNVNMTDIENHVFIPQELQSGEYLDFDNYDVGPSGERIIFQKINENMYLDVSKQFLDVHKNSDGNYRSPVYKLPQRLLDIIGTK